MADDPFAVLGVAPDAGPDEVAAAYRAQAKRWHPDVAGVDAEAARQMATINAAYDAIRAGDLGRLGSASETPTGPAPPARPGRRPGAWLSDDTRRALGRELLGALDADEPVRLVCDAATWASPTARLVLTDRRLLWLLDDAVTHRVRTLRFRDVERAEHRLQWPRRRRAQLRVHTRAGRRLEFADLAPAVAQRLAGALAPTGSGGYPHATQA